MDPKILAFDVFGTVVDWHGSIAAEAKRLSLPVDPNEFATAWRNGYKPAMAKVRSGTLPWTKIDDLHRMILDDILKTFNITSLSESQIHELNLVWHRLNPWLDTVEGLTKLKSKFTIVTLSNGNLGLLADMAKNAGLPWDLILSAEVFRHYKPDPETYLGVAEIFNVLPEQVMLVAAHKDDLLSANACGLQTAFIERPLEFGPNFSRQDLHREEFTTYHAEDLMDLATQLNC
ncbi:haloacid dehalogenase type II [Polynucleobacter sp. AP-Nickl1-40-C4]|nr:haloacid dehalogenase type II [Polynucleobacter sp. AP-Nickl1-40-C4]MEA9568552.1 haloacid dehalogenase type II [Polynucleobacter sp. AP-Nickl1-40-C4]